MTRAQFLNDLYRRLGGLSKEQAEQHLTYYAEMLADRMEEGMTEEEAVASMEDVDTIAQRILQDEGVSGNRPPRAPDLPEAERMTDFQGNTPAVKPKRDWRGPAKVALWALAILAVGGMLFSRFAARSGDSAVDGSVIEDCGTYESVPEAPEPPDSLELGGVHVGPDGIHVGDGEHSVSVGPDGIHIDGDWDDWDDWDDLDDIEEWTDLGAWTGLVDSGNYDYTSEEYQVAASGIRDIEVEWLAGQVEIYTGDSENITFWEEAAQELTEKNQLACAVKGEKLRISYWKEWPGKAQQCAKRLTLYIPAEMLDELEVSTISGDVLLADLSVRSIEVDTTSGNISGNVTVRELGVGTVSGDADMVLAEPPKEIELDSVSGDLILDLGSAGGFTLEFDTVSGDLDTGDFQTSVRGGRYTSGDGSCKIEVSTVSGDLTLLGG